jgi:hypothetical protein
MPQSTWHPSTSFIGLQRSEFSVLIRAQTTRVVTLRRHIRVSLYLLALHGDAIVRKHAVFAPSPASGKGQGYADEAQPDPLRGADCSRSRH